MVRSAFPCGNKKSYAELTPVATTEDIAMALMDTLKSLFGGKTDAGNPAANQSMAGRPEESVEYKDCLISPTPIKEGNQYRTAGTISDRSSNEVRASNEARAPDEAQASQATRETRFIRADNHSSREQAVEHCVTKAKQIIDERGANLFDSERC